MDIFLCRMFITVHPEPVEGCVAQPFMLRQACPEQPFILREPQDERLVEGLSTNGFETPPRCLYNYGPISKNYIIYHILYSGHCF